MIGVVACLLILSAFSAADAQILRWGSCPEVSYQQNFVPEKYFSGIFYEQKRFWTMFEVGAKCVHAEYTVRDNGHVLVNNSGLSTWNGKRTFAVGDAYCDDTERARCFVRYSSASPYGSYNLLAADPDKFGLVFSCKEIVPGVLNTQLAWILTRDKVVSDTDMQKYIDVFKSMRIDIKKFQTTAQDCDDN